MGVSCGVEGGGGGGVLLGVEGVSGGEVSLIVFLCASIARILLLVNIFCLGE